MTMMNKVELTEYYSDDKSLKSVILKDNSNYGYYVDLYKNGDIIKTCDVVNHSLRYAEDLALNYVEGVLKF
jgi:antitoxin component YwqK of YwqJK toxin-antitoxin module